MILEILIQGKIKNVKIFNKIKHKSLIYNTTILKGGLKMLIYSMKKLNTFLFQFVKMIIGV